MKCLHLDIKPRQSLPWTKYRSNKSYLALTIEAGRKDKTFLLKQIVSLGHGVGKTHVDISPYPFVKGSVTVLGEDQAENTLDSNATPAIRFSFQRG